jgi:hypothetical protein
MRSKFARLPLILLFAALSLAACASRNDPPMSAGLAEDDDTYCRANNVQPGSPAYVACRKERDAQRSGAASRADARQRDLADYMLNHPVHP